jgi:hypothetical protein
MKLGSAASPPLISPKTERWATAGSSRIWPVAAPTECAPTQLAWRTPRMTIPSNHRKGIDEMTSVLYVGRQPETVDCTDPALPPGTTAEKIHARIALALEQMTERGWSADLCLVQPDETAGPKVERKLTSKPYDCVMIAAGIRRSPLSIFEAVINAVHKAAPRAVIAFNAHPEDSVEAVARQLQGVSRCA